MKGSRAQAHAALDALVASDAAIRAAEAAQVQAVVDLAQHYSVDMDAVVEHLAERTMRCGGEGAPEVSEFHNLEIAPALGISERSAGALVVSALNLRYRHPRLYEAVTQHRIRRWQADMLTDLARDLPQAAADWVDRRIALVVDRMPFGRLKGAAAGWIAQAAPALQAEKERAERERREVYVADHRDGSSTLVGRLGAADALALDRTVEELAQQMAALGMLADPSEAVKWLTGETLDAAPVKRRAVVHLHLAADTLADPDTGVVRVEGIGPLTTTAMREFLTGCHVTVRPVLDAATVPAVDNYEIPDRMRELVLRRFPYDVFPFGMRSSRGLDLDHGIPFDTAAGTTCPCNLAPISRRAHRAKTAGAWRFERIRPDGVLWTSPLGYRYEVSPSGTVIRKAPDDPPATADVQ